MEIRITMKLTPGSSQRRDPIILQKIIIPRWKVRKYDFKKCRPKRRKLQTMKRR